MITVFTKNQCVQCRAAKKMLQNGNVQYIEVNVDVDEQAGEQLRAEGWLQLPVIKTNKGEFSGFYPELIKKLCYTNIS